MISDCNFSTSKLYNLLVENDKAFTLPLSQTLQTRGLLLSDYVNKLASFGTIAYETDGHGVIKGIIIGYTNNLPEDRGSYIAQVVTCYKYRKQGVFSRLIREYIDFCKTKGVKYVWLTTHTSNVTAQHAYEKAGFHRNSSNDFDLIKYIYPINFIDRRKSNGD